MMNSPAGASNRFAAEAASLSVLMAQVCDIISE